MIPFAEESSTLTQVLAVVVTLVTMVLGYLRWRDEQRFKAMSEQQKENTEQIATLKADHAACRQENAELRAENAALRHDVDRLQGEMRSMIAASRSKP